MWPRRSIWASRLLLAALLPAALVTVAPGRAQQAGVPAIRSATEFLSDELKAEQADPLRNRGMLWVDHGEELWRSGPPAAERSCAGCHGDATASMRGVATRYPAVDARSGALMNLEARINACRTRYQRLPELAYESNALLALTAYVAVQSRGLPLAPRIEGAAQPYFESGRNLWFERQGQLNLACAQCHDDNAGRRLRGDIISSGIGTGYPAYRLEWQGLGSLHRRLRACQTGVRATMYEPGAPEYLALELYIAWRARGAPIETPALRR